MTKRSVRAKKTEKIERRFGGKRFGMRFREKNKSNATRTAHRLKEDGNNTRIVKIKGAHGKNYYAIYARNKRY